MQDNIDVLVDDDGDFVVDGTGDLTLATALQTVQQDIKFRALTSHHDYGPDRFIGANLSSFVGKPNTRRNGDYMKAALQDALVRDARFGRGDISVDAVPVSKTQVALPVFLKDAVQGVESEIYNRTVFTVATFMIDTHTGTITDITGGER